MNKSQETAFKKFIIRYTVVGSVCTWLLATQLREFLDAIVDNITEPLFSMDINKDGKPDIQQLNKMILDVSGIKFPVGRILLGIIKTIFAIILIYLMVQLLYRYTDLLKI
jgi:large-conductance mechanosensitive channel